MRPEGARASIYKQNNQRVGSNAVLKLLKQLTCAAALKHVVSSEYLLFSFFFFCLLKDEGIFG